MRGSVVYRTKKYQETEVYGVVGVVVHEPQRGVKDV